MKKIIILVIIMSSFVLLGCQSEITPDVKKMITSTMDQLKTGNTKAYVNAILPSQRNRWRKFVTRHGFFRTLNDYSLFLDLSEMDDDTHAHVVVYMKYPKNTKTSFRTFLVKKSNKWYIDFKKSYDSERRKNGIHAFSALKYTY